MSARCARSFRCIRIGWRRIRGQRTRGWKIEDLGSRIAYANTRLPFAIFGFPSSINMKCPFCHEIENRVIDSRLSKDSNMIRRRRECERCSRRFTTYERVEEMMPMVIKKDGRRENYDRVKIINGLKRACEKRPVSINTIEAVADRVERTIQERGEKEIPSSVIGEALMRELHDTDPVAYVRFASVYRSFKDISEFLVELEELIKERKSSSALANLRPRRE